MSEFPLGYERVPPTTWAYLSSLLMLALYLKFSRFWSVRNLDLILIILLAPGLLLVHAGATTRIQLRGEIDQQLLEMARAEQMADLEDGSPGLAAGEGGSESALVPLTLDQLDPEQRQAIDMLVGERAATYQRARLRERTGYVWLFAVEALLLVRMLCDPLMVRRPMLEPNLTSGGLTFMGGAMLVFMVANIVTSEPVRQDLYTVGELSADQTWWDAESNSPTLMPGPGYRPLYQAPILPTFVDSPRPLWESGREVGPMLELLSKIVVVLSLLAIVAGILLVGYLHFENFWMGIGIAVLFLMLPYTVQMMGRVSHVFPAALLVWAIVAYRMPYASGLLLGLATGAVYYPMFLLPLWLSFYWRRGMTRFLIGFAIAILFLTGFLMLGAVDASEFWGDIQAMFGLWPPKHSGLQGIWALGWEPVFRMPIMAASLAISGALVLWPSRKDLGTLLSCSCAVMIAVQFWHGFGGGLSMAWYLPLALLTIFRPNLEDRVALSVLKESWLFRRRALRSSRSQAA